MYALSLALLSVIVTNANARPNVRARQAPDVAVWVTETAIETTHATVATVWDTAFAQPTAMALQGSQQPTAVPQVQVYVNEISAEYTYSSARTVFVVPTILSSTITQTAPVYPSISAGSTIYPESTITISNTINAAQTPSDAAQHSPITATLPMMSVLIAGQTVTVPEQTFTYYAATVANLAITDTTDSPATSPSQPQVTTPSENTTTSASSAQTMAEATAQSSIQTSPNTQPVVGAPSFYDNTATTQPFVTTGELTTATTAGTSTMTTASPSATSSGFALASQPEFVTSMLTAINGYRNRHSAPGLYWNYTLATSALAYAQACNLEHASDPTFGETLAAGTSVDLDFYVDLWYTKEAASYDYNNPGFSLNTGHFTQLVWASTASVGCGFSSGCGSEYPNFLVCRYDVAGNVVGGANNNQYFVQNVFAS